MANGDMITIKNGDCFVQGNETFIVKITKDKSDVVFKKPIGLTLHHIQDASKSLYFRLSFLNEENSSAKK